MCLLKYTVHHAQTGRNSQQTEKEEGGCHTAPLWGHEWSHAAGRRHLTEFCLKKSWESIHHKSILSIKPNKVFSLTNKLWVNSLGQVSELFYIFWWCTQISPLSVPRFSQVSQVQPECNWSILLRSRLSSRCIPKASTCWFIRKAANS